MREHEDGDFKTRWRDAGATAHERRALHDAFSPASDALPPTLASLERALARSKARERVVVPMRVGRFAAVGALLLALGAWGLGAWRRSAPPRGTGAAAPGWAARAPDSDAPVRGAAGEVARPEALGPALHRLPPVRPLTSAPAEYRVVDGAYELQRGRFLAQRRELRSLPERFRWQTYQIELRAGRFVAEVSESGAWIQVEAGAAHIRGPDGTERRVTAGDGRVHLSPAPALSPVSPAPSGRAPAQPPRRPVEVGRAPVVSAVPPRAVAPSPGPGPSRGGASFEGPGLEGGAERSAETEAEADLRRAQLRLYQSGRAALRSARWSDARRIFSEYLNAYPSGSLRWAAALSRLEAMAALSDPAYCVTAERLQAQAVTAADRALLGQVLSTSCTKNESKGAD